MSLLGERLNQYIEESGYTVYRLSQLSGVNRTTIVRMINGNRIPDRKNMEKLVPWLKLTPSQRKALWEAYELMTSGEELFLQRNNFMKMLLDMYNPINQEKVFQFDRPESGVLLNMDLCKSTQILRGTFQIIHILTGLILSRKIDEVCVFAPFTNEFISDFFGRTIFTELSRIRVKHIMYFVKSSQNCHYITYNLSTLSHMLSLAFTAGVDYRAYYVYVKQIISDDTFVPYPYYIIMGDAVIHLSSNFDKAVVTVEKAVVEDYKHIFERILSDSEKLFHAQNDIGYALDDIEPVVAVLDSVFGISPYPQLLIISDRKNALKMIKKKGKEVERYYRVFNEHAHKAGSMKKRAYYFPEAGLRYFVMTGRTPELPAKYAESLSVEERIGVLEKLKTEILRDSVHIRILDTVHFPVRRPVAIQMTADKRVFFYCLDKENRFFRYVMIRESSLTWAISEFVEYLSKDPVLYSDYFYSKEKTLECIDYYLGMLERGEISGESEEDRESGRSQLHVLDSSEAVWAEGLESSKLLEYIRHDRVKKREMGG
ncbi:MAG: helix-turn-helix transcriptional regulator [Lachnospiraceae bacterium]|nr:helix-turn-helix transcriptional regulator [Lachnospiraceae bacterium]